MASNQEPDKARPPPLPPRPLPSAVTPDTTATRPSARHSDGRLSPTCMSQLEFPPLLQAVEKFRFELRPEASRLDFQKTHLGFSAQWTKQLVTKPSDENLLSEYQASCSDWTSKSLLETAHILSHIAPVSSSDQAVTLDSIPESAIPSLDISRREDSEQALPAIDEGPAPASRPSHERVDSATSEFSFCLDSISQEGPQESDHRKDSYDEKLAEIDRLEISEILRRSSKYLNEVNFQVPESESTEAPIPTLDSFRSSAGEVDWVGFWTAYAAAQLERYCPNALRSSPTRAPVSMSQLKAQASRSYVAVLPELWDIISGNHLSNIYRWENPRRTIFYVFSYYLLWAMDMIPSFIVGYGLYLLMNRQLNPPTISQLRQEVNQRHQLGKQAETIGAGGFLDIKNGSVTKGVLGNSMVFAGVALGANVPGTGASATGPNPSSSHTLPKKSDYRGLYSFSRSLYSDHGQEIQTMLADIADIGEKVRNLYLWRRPLACWRTSFMLVAVLLYTMAISQKWLVKNFLGWLGIEFFFLLGFADKHPKFRKILNPIWLLLYDIPTDSEFALEVLQERGKNTNQSMLHHSKLFKRPNHHPSSFLHKKSQSASSLPDRKGQDSTDERPVNPATQPQRDGITSSDRSVPSALRSVPDAETWKRWTHKVGNGSSGILNMAKKIYAGGENSQSEDKSNDLLDNNIKTFAILNGRIPGNLAVQRDWICFEPLKGFRSKTSQMKSAVMKPDSTCAMPRTRPLSTSSSSLSSITRSKATRKPSGEDLGREAPIEEGREQTDELPDLSAGGTTPTPDLIIHFHQIIKIKKVKRSIVFGLGFRISDGIEFHLNNSTVLSFDNILNRDEYFNQLLLLCSRPDPKGRQQTS